MMKSKILNECKFEIKTPNNCSRQEIDSFHKKVLKGGKVSSIGLPNRIKNCELLAFCYLDGKLVGVSSVKNPNKTYVENIIEKAKLERKYEDLNFEIGYSFTEPKFERNGISSSLKKGLLEKMKSRKGKILFSTTAIKSSQNFFEANGFEKQGESYDGDNDKGITYYECRL